MTKEQIKNISNQLIAKLKTCQRRDRGKIYSQLESLVKQLKEIESRDLENDSPE